MKKTLLTTAAIAAFALVTAPAMAADPVDADAKTKVEHKDNGGYTSTTTKNKTDALGTEVKAGTKVDVDVDDDGKVTKTIKNERITDPKGILNERAATTETKVEEKDRGYERETRTSSSNAAGTSTLSKEKRDVKVDAQGNVIETTKIDKVVDPKGLMNREAVTTEQKRVNGQTVETTTR